MSFHPSLIVLSANCSINQYFPNLFSNFLEKFEIPVNKNFTFERNADLSLPLMIEWEGNVEDLDFLESLEIYIGGIKTFDIPFSLIKIFEKIQYCIKR